MKSLSLIAAVFGALALASPNAIASTDSSSFRVLLTIAAPCDVSTDEPSTGRGGVTVRCESASTPYRLEMDAPAPTPRAGEMRVEESDGYSRATLTF